MAQNGYGMEGRSGRGVRVFLLGCAIDVINLARLR
jgi:hypothetical protein